MSKIKKEVVEYYSFCCPGCKHLHVYAVKNDNTGWQFNGNLERPSFTPSLLNSIKVQNEVSGVYDVEKNRCHLFVTDGKIIYCGDCTHELKGQTIELPEI
jgi:hypothetical protein